MNRSPASNPNETAASSDGSTTEATAAAASHAHIDFETLPPLFRDRAFWGMTITQFLGAFNDSVFRQIVLLLCATVLIAPAPESLDKQFIALAIFSMAFILFSGIAGYWSDRVSKKSIVVGSKVGEIVVMLLAIAAFYTMATRVPRGEIFLTRGMPWFVLAVLFLMGTQSAIFGPAKYGILPEMVRAKDLPRFNGVIQMTTFVALIIGPYLGGYLLDTLGQEIWKAAAICVLIAVVGTATSLLVRRTPVAEVGAPFHLSAFAVAPDTWEILKKDRPLRRALWVYSIFWFVASIFPMAVNALGLDTFGLNYTQTSFLPTVVSIGIAIGFVIAGTFSHERVNFGLVRIGTWGLIAMLLLLSLPDGTKPHVAEDGSEVWGHLLGRYLSFIPLAAMGFFAGFFALPVQVFLQSRPPEHLKGRVIGTMNLINWIAIIIASAVFYPMCLLLFKRLALPSFAIFGVTGLVLLPVALFYHPRDTAL